MNKLQGLNYKCSLLFIAGILSACASCDSPRRYSTIHFDPRNPKTPEEAYFKAQISGYASQFTRPVREACEKKLEGTTVIDLYISPKGEFTEAKLVKSSGHAVLDEEILQTWQRVKDFGGKLDVSKDPRFEQNSGVVYRIHIHSTQK